MGVGIVTTPVDFTTTDAYQASLAMLRSVGLDALAPTLLGILQSGYTDPSAIQAQLQQTDAWKQRFAGNQIRLQKGLNALSVDQYLANENAYKTVLRNSGLPQGFYDDKSTMDNWIGNDVSPEELGRRVSAASQVVQQVDPNDRAAFQHYYGVDSGHLMAYFLDPQKGEQILQQQAQAAQIGGAATRQGLALTDQSRALQYAQQGLTADQANKAYGDIAALLPEERNIAMQQGQAYSQSDAEDEILGGLASAQRKRQLLNQGEQSMFAGRGGVGSSFTHEDYGLSTAGSGQF